MDNPYDPPSDHRSDEPVAFAHPFFDFLSGFRNGALYSLILAIPTGFVLYGEYAAGRNFVYDAARQTTTQVELTSSDRWFCIIAALMNTAVAITLPWAFAAGIANWRKERKR